MKTIITIEDTAGVEKTNVRISCEFVAPAGVNPQIVSMITELTLLAVAMSDTSQQAHDIGCPESMMM